jgi:hypothetical protein
MKWSRFIHVSRSRLRKGNPQARPQTRRLRLESLEARLAPAFLSIVPLAVPADQTTTFHTVGEALNAPSLVNGDTIQIEPGATPGKVDNSNLNNVLNLTIQGNPLAGPNDFAPLTLDNLDVDAAEAGLTFRNLHLINVSDTLNLNANATFDRVIFDNYFLGVGLSLNSTTGVQIRGSALTDYNPATTVSTLPFISVTPGANAHNVFFGNRIETTLSHGLMTYGAAIATVTTDEVVGNTFVANPAGGGAVGMFAVTGKINGLVVRDNSFTDPDNAVVAIVVGNDNQNIIIERNTISFLNDVSVQGISISGGAAVTSARVLNNRIDTAGNGVALVLNPGVGAFNVEVEGNDFNHNKIGVQILGANVANIDLGGGSQGSRGANNFRGFSTPAAANAGAIVTVGGAAATVNAQNNLFGVPDPETVIFDAADNGALANVDATGALTGNQAFVQALFVRFLRRAGNLADPNDAGGLVAKLNSGTTPAAVASSVIRSAEAFGLVVDDLHLRILRRAADPVQRAKLITQLRQGKLSVDSLTATLYASAEYRATHPSATGYVAALFTDLLGRTPTATELASQEKAVNSLGRRAAALRILASTEYRKQVVTAFFRNLLHRSTPPTAAEVNALVSKPLSLFAIQVRMAGSTEFRLKG